MRASEWAVALGLFVLSAVAWLGPTVWASGGILTMWRLIEGYLAAQSRGKSIFFGAASSGALLMAYKALVWTGIGALSWVWALRKISPGPDRLWFLFIWCAPAFLFHSLVHIDDPGHALITIPAVCLIGGWALASLTASRARFAAAVTAAVAINVAIFLYPIDPVTEQSSYPHIQSLDRVTSSTIDRIAILQKNASGKGNSLVILSAGEPVSWRTLSYYFPRTPIHALLTDLRIADPRPEAFSVKGGKVLPVEVSNLRLPGCGRIAVVAPQAQLSASLISDPEKFEEHGMVWDRAAEPGLALRAGPYRFQTDSQCEAAQ
jgi:hypothetical protein